MLDYPIKIHIDESKVCLLQEYFNENAEDEGGVFNVYDIQKPEGGDPTLMSTYQYVPNDDNIYADFSNYKGNADLSAINGGKGGRRVVLGQGDLVKTKDNLKPDAVPVGENQKIDCYNLSMLGDDAVKTMLAHAYKGKPAAYPLNQKYRIQVTNSDGTLSPNLIQGDYLKKMSMLIKQTPGLGNFNPNYVIYPQSSSKFNEYILNFLTDKDSKYSPFPNAIPVSKDSNGEFIMAKNNIWGIDYSTLIDLGKADMKRNYGYREFYSKNPMTKQLYEKDYFLSQITTLLEPRILKLIPLVRKQYYLEKVNGRKGRPKKFSFENREYYVLTPYAQKLLEASAASGGLTGKELEDLLSGKHMWNGDVNMTPDKLAQFRDWIKNREISPKEAERAEKEQFGSGQKLVNINDIQNIEKQMSPHELRKMYDFVEKTEMSQDEKDYLTRFIHEYFMDEMVKFNEAGKRWGLTFDFTKPPFGEELLLRIYRNIFSHDRKTADSERLVNGFSKGKNEAFPDYKTFLQNFVNGTAQIDGKNKKFFDFNIPAVIKNAEKNDTIKNYPIVPRMSIYNQFKFNDNVDLNKFKRNGRYLIIDDNFASGASLRNAAKLLHDAIGVPYENIKALTPGDMGGAATGGLQGPQVATNSAEGNLVYLFRNGYLNNYLDNGDTTNKAILSRLQKVSTQRTDKGELAINHTINDALRTSQMGRLGTSSNGSFRKPEEINPEFGENDVQNFDFSIRNFKKFLQPKNGRSSTVVRKEEPNIQEPSSRIPSHRGRPSSTVAQVLSRIDVLKSRRDGFEARLKMAYDNGDIASVREIKKELAMIKYQLRAADEKLASLQSSSPNSTVENPQAKVPTQNVQTPKQPSRITPLRNQEKESQKRDLLTQLSTLVKSRPSISQALKTSRSMEERNKNQAELNRIDSAIRYLRNEIGRKQVKYQ